MERGRYGVLLLYETTGSLRRVNLPDSSWHTELCEGAMAADFPDRNPLLPAP